MAAQMMTDIETLYRPTHDERARQQFVSTLRKHAIVDLRNMMKRDWESRVEPSLEARGEAPEDWRGIERAMEKEDSFRFYSAVRYNAQEMSFLSVQDTVERALPDMIDVAKDAAVRNPAGGSLRIPGNFEVPRYVSSLDVHLIPGSFDAEYTTDDVAQGAVVAFGSKVFAGQHPFRKKPGAVAESVGNWMRLKYPDFRPRRILDLGTSSGKNLFPYAGVFPGAELHGVDVGAPLLRFAHARARALGYDVHYSQQDARRLDFEDGTFDLVVSSFFLHEQSKATNRQVLKEAHRLLRPGGIMVHMELPPAGEVDPYYNFYLDWDAYYNNEPHYAGFRELDPVDECVRAGFARSRCFARRIPNYGVVSDEEFAESARGLRPAPPHGNGASWFIFGAVKGTR
jgi:SAM-dependent methyltransferase